jgi:hypothetical protein
MFMAIYLSGTYFVAGYLAAGFILSDISLRAPAHIPVSCMTTALKTNK